MNTPIKLLHPVLPLQTDRDMLTQKPLEWTENDMKPSIIHLNQVC